jgi:hypothetical protein
MVSSKTAKRDETFTRKRVALSAAPEPGRVPLVDLSLAAA